MLSRWVLLPAITPIGVSNLDDWDGEENKMRAAEKMIKDTISTRICTNIKDVLMIRKKRLLNMFRQEVGW